MTEPPWLPVAPKTMRILLTVMVVFHSCVYSFCKLPYFPKLFGQRVLSKLDCRQYCICIPHLAVDAQEADPWPILYGPALYALVFDGRLGSSTADFEGSRLDCIRHRLWRGVRVDISFLSTQMPTHPVVAMNGQRRIQLSQHVI